MKIRYRFSGDPATGPMHGDYLMSARGRGGYLILGIDHRGQRGGLGQPVYTLLILTVERASREQCLAAGDRLWSIAWDVRKRRAPHRFNDDTRYEGTAQ